MKALNKALAGLALTAAFAAAGFSEDFSGIAMKTFTSKKMIEYTIGEDVQTITATRYLNDFSMNKFETTYGLWYKVRRWGERNGYNFENEGQEGSDGTIGRAPTSQGKNQPVTRISWYDAVVWCNALSEMEGLTPCYTYRGQILRDSGNTAHLDLCECKWDADGYRLPTESEWEYAARKTAVGIQRGDYASGENENIPAERVAWIFDNSTGTHIVGSAGIDSPLEDVPILPASGYANRSGLYDMTGNVLEFCWDWLGEHRDSAKGKPYVGPKIGEGRVAKGGAWSEETCFYYVGDRYSFDPNEAYDYLGFRIVQSKK